MNLLEDNPVPRRFQMVRTIDETGISGTGIVATGVEFPDGVCVLHWNTNVNSTTVFQNVGDLLSLHGHNGATGLFYLDDPNVKPDPAPKLT